MMPFPRKALLGVAVAVLLLAPAIQNTAVAQISIPVEQTASEQGSSAFTGTLTVNNFQVVNGQLMAVGILSGQLAETSGNPQSQDMEEESSVAQPAQGSAGNLEGTSATVLAVPVIATATCDALRLSFPATDVMFMQTQLRLDQITFDLTAQPSASAIVGNRLCSIATLLGAAGTPAATSAATGPGTSATTATTSASAAVANQLNALLRALSGTSPQR